MPEATVFTLTVLVVDDLDDAAQSTAELLTLCGHSVRVARSGADALAAVAAATPDVILLDIGLPGMDGWEVAGRVRRQVSGKQPFVVAVSGFASPNDQSRSADAGIDLHLVKPVDPVALAGLLEQVRDNIQALPRRSFACATAEGRQ